MLLGSYWGVLGSLGGLLGALGGALWRPWSDLGGSGGSLGRPWKAHGPPTESFWSYLGVILESFLGPKSGGFRDKFFDDFFNGFGVDVGSIWERFWNQFSVRKRSERENVDFQKPRFYNSKT